MRTAAELEEKTAAVRARYGMEPTPSGANRKRSGSVYADPKTLDKLKETFSSGIQQATETGKCTERKIRRNVGCFRPFFDYNKRYTVWDLMRCIPLANSDRSSENTHTYPAWQRWKGDEWNLIFDFLPRRRSCCCQPVVLAD